MQTIMMQQNNTNTIMAAKMIAFAAPLKPRTVYRWRDKRRKHHAATSEVSEKAFRGGRRRCDQSRRCRRPNLCTHAIGEAQNSHRASATYLQ